MSRIHLRSARLSTQIVVSAIAVLLVVASIGVIVERRHEYAETEEAIRAQAEQTMSLIGILISNSIAADDISVVESVLQDAVTLSPMLEYAAVRDRSGNPIAAFPDNQADSTDDISEFRADLQHEGRAVGQILTQWSTGPARLRTEAHVTQAMLLMSAVLVSTGLFFLFLVSHLALRPLSRIHANMAAALRRENVECRALPKFAAKELVALSDCVDALEGILQERDQKQADLKDAHLAVEASSKSKSEFLASMSHEIRTPMNGVLGMAELLLDTDLSSDQRGYAETIAKSGSALLPIINDILDFSKIEAGKLTLHPEPFDLHRAIEDLVTMISAKAYQKEVEINVRYDPDLPAGFIGDEGRIRQILANVVGNAVKFTLEGHVLIDVKGHSENNRSQLRIEVSDTGIGIPEAKIKSIFNEFEQSGSALGSHFEGSGLGLSIANRLVRMMGGTIGVRSEEGKGSVFTIQLNLEQAKEIEPVNLADVRDLLNRKVLIVDDMQINRTILSERLRNWGVLHKAVNSGAEALEVLEAASKSGDNFDAIIVDYHMPEMNGCELAARIRDMKSCRSIPIILLSSVDVAREPLTESPSIFEIYLLKPVRSDTLKAVLANAVSKKGSELMPEPDKTAATPTQSVLTGKTILIAEDNKTNQLVLQTMLKSLEVEVITVENGEEALQSYISRPPDLILMDMAMPVLDGLDATRKIREFEKQNGIDRKPIIALTANAMTGDRDTCLDAGMDDYLSKPVIKSNLVATMEQWLDLAPEVEASERNAQGMASGGRDGPAKAS